MKTPNIETRIKTQTNIEDLPILLNAIRDDLKIRDVEMAHLCQVTPHTLATWRRGSAVPKDFVQVYCISVALVEWDRGSSTTYRTGTGTPRNH